jgi:prepilin-type N-terminal cleavage/methylation domain-containing protein
MKSLRSRGFTLIELLVVIAIIGLLASIILASLNTAQQKGRDARRLEDLKEMGNAIAVATTGGTITFVGSGSLVSGYTVPAGLTSYNDPSQTGTCAAAAAGAGAACNYSIFNTNVAGGSTGITSNNFEICAYLESGSGAYSKGMISMSASSTGNIVGGCN